MRVLLDEHYSLQIAAELQNDGYDVVAVTGIRLQGIDDEPLLAFAAVEERALLTNTSATSYHWARVGAGRTRPLRADLER